MLILKIILSFTIFYFEILNYAESEFYSSVHEMSRLVEFENVFLKRMQSFVKENENKLEYLKERLREYERERDEVELIGKEAYFDSPVNKYLLTKHLTIDWERIENLMEAKTGQKVLTNLNSFKSNRNLPDERELEGAIEGILRLQEVYRLRTKDIAEGILDGINYNTTLETRHCFDIGKVAKKINKLRLSHSWLMETLKRLGSQTKIEKSMEVIDERVNLPDVIFHLAQVKNQLGDILGANVIFAQLLLYARDNETYAKAYEEFSLQHANKTEYPCIDFSDEHYPIPKNFATISEYEQYKFTCSGHIRITPPEERNLHCGYLTETHPFLNLAPIKVEELYHDPLLVQFYDVMSDNEIAILKKLTNHRMSRAKVMSTGGPVVSKFRTSQFVFIPKTEHRLLQTIDERVQDMTNLNMIFAEDHQFVNYGIGGHYAQHHDYFHAEAIDNNLVAEIKFGNRIATVLIYLSDVEQGGGTAFPYMKRLAMPKKGSAVFWYNLHASGDRDVRTLHGACPIIVGSKWVLNRWIHEYFQESRPCLLYNDAEKFLKK